MAAVPRCAQLSPNLYDPCCCEPARSLRILWWTASLAASGSHSVQTSGTDVTTPGSRVIRETYSHVLVRGREPSLRDGAVVCAKPSHNRGVFLTSDR